MDEKRKTLLVYSIETKHINYGEYILRGNAYQLMDQTDKAVEDFDKAIQMEPDNIDAYLMRGCAYKDTGQNDRFIKDFNKVIQLNPNHIDAYFDTICVLSIKNNIEEACKWLKKIIDTGFCEWENIKKDKRLDNIRRTSCYKEIMTGK